MSSNAGIGHRGAPAYSGSMRWLRIRRAALAALFGLAALGGGLASGSLWPVYVETDYYAAHVRLSPDWTDRTSIGTDTVVGSASARFAGLAPGIRVEPRVKPEITDLVESDELSRASLSIGTEDRARVIREAATGLTLRVAGGAAAGCAVVLLGVGLHRRGLPTKGVTATGVVVTAAVVGVTALGAHRAYDPDRMEELHSSGLLELAVSNRNLLGDIDTRATQATPYLRNLLALSTALQQEYAPQQLPTDSALNVLLVSDIHSADQYALMRTIIEEQDIDVVVDSGDLITWGSVEAGVSRLHDSIATLDVPYVFVRGNHDASWPTDTRLLREMEETDNVVLLEPRPGEYREAEVGGLRIAGFNDPRYFRDPLKGDEDNQHEARDAWLAAWDDRPAPDLTVSHEPAAVDDVPGQLRINGHLHAPDLDGNRVQVGSFTGAGTLRHFVESTDGELVGQPNAFDVLTFDEDCRAQALTRYQFRSIISGRPTYDSLSMVNADRIAEDLEDDEDDRVCGGGDLQVESVSED